MSTTLLSCVIYGLFDPNTSMCRYIGRTAGSLTQRLETHYYDKSDTYKTRWIASLKINNQRPTIQILETGNWNRSQANVKEIWWIAQAKQMGWRITNSTSGGDGMLECSEETRQKMRAAWVSRKTLPESAETSARRSAALRARVRKPETNIKISESVKAKWTDPEFKQKQRQIMLDWWAKRRSEQALLEDDV